MGLGDWGGEARVRVRCAVETLTVLVPVSHQPVCEAYSAPRAKPETRNALSAGAVGRCRASVLQRGWATGKLTTRTRYTREKVTIQTTGRRVPPCILAPTRYPSPPPSPHLSMPNGGEIHVEELTHCGRGERIWRAVFWVGGGSRSGPGNCEPEGEGEGEGGMNVDVDAARTWVGYRHVQGVQYQ